MKDDTMQQVLIIDDDELALMVLRTLLEDAGYGILATADGPHGIELYKHHRPDLVLLDLGLPSISGMGVLKQIREFDPEAKVIIITGYGSPQAANAAMEGGALDFLEKPVKPPELLQKVRQALRVIDG